MSNRDQKARERRYAAVIYADISGSTALSEVLDPDEIHDIMAECLTLLQQSALDHGASLVKFRGDAVLALFGIPVAQEDATRAAVNASIEIRNSIAALRRERGWVATLDVHTGVNAGIMASGDMSGSGAAEIDVAGDAVNVAARLSDAAPAGCIYVGPAVEHETRANFDYRALPALRLKGKAKQFRAFELLSTSEQIHRSLVDAAASARAFVGRGVPLTTLDEALTSLSSGTGKIVSLVGAAGIGKSRLLTELRSHTHEDAFVWLEGRSVAAGNKLAFHPFSDLLRSWSEIGDAEESAAAFEKLDAAVSKEFGADGDVALPVLAVLAGVRAPDEIAARIADVDGEAMEQLVLKSIRQLFQQLAKHRPLVLVFEDLHWADGSSIALLRSLFSLASQSAVLFLLAYRPDFPETAGRVRQVLEQDHSERHRVLELGPLDSDSSEKLLADFLRAGQIPPTLQKLIATRAAGNPFYLGEIIRSLVDAGVLVSGRAGLSAIRDPGLVELPGTIRDVILYRLDRLAEGPRSVLQSAAVIGARVRIDTLRQILPDDPDLSTHLKELVRSQHLEQAVGRHATDYVFGHPLVEEVAYASIPQGRRRALHLAVAHAVEDDLDEASSSHALLAYHYGLGGENSRAEEHLFKAGEEAARVAASREALHFFQQASKAYLAREPGAEDDPALRRALEKNLALAYFNRGHLIEAVEHFNRTLELYGEKVPRTRFEMLTVLLRTLSVILVEPYLSKLFRKRPAATDAEREIIGVMFYRARAQTTADTTAFLVHGLDTVRKLRGVDPTTVPGAGGMMSGAIGLFTYSGVSPAIAGRFLEQARLLIDPADVKEVALFGMMNFVHHMFIGDWKREHEIDENIIDRSLRLGRLWDITIYLGFHAKSCVHQGRFEAAEREIVRLAEIAETYDYDVARQNYSAVRTFLALERGELEQARVLSVHYSNTMDEDAPHVFALGLEAKILAQMGRLEEAAERLERAQALIAQAGIILPFQMSTVLVARLIFDLAQLERAIAEGAATRKLGRCAMRSGKKAVRMARKVAAKRVETYRLFGRCHWLLGHRDRAIDWWHRSIAAGESLGALPQRARTKIEVADRFLEAGIERCFLGLNPNQLRQEGEDELADLGICSERVDTGSKHISSSSSDRP